VGTTVYLVYVVICEFNCDETSPCHDYVKCKPLPHHKPIGWEKTDFFRRVVRCKGGAFNCVKVGERKKKSRDKNLLGEQKKTLLGNKTKVSFSVCLFF